MNDGPHTCGEASRSQPSDSPGKKPPRKLWRRFLHYEMRRSHQRKAEREKKRAEEKPEERAARKTAEATVWIAIFTIVLALVGIFTLVEVIKGGGDTHELAVQAKRQADQMKDVSDAADRIKQAAQDMVVQDQKLADNSKNALDASNRQSREALNASIASSRLDQRPYIVTDAPAFNQTSIVGNHEITANITFRNIGKTPALKILHNLTMQPYTGLNRDTYIQFMDRLFTDLKSKDRQGRHQIESSPYPEEDIAPQATQYATNPPITLSPEDVTVLLADNGPNVGKETLFYVGIISYTDGSGAPYKTQYCYFYFGNNVRVWHICDNHNTIQ